MIQDHKVTRLLHRADGDPLADQGGREPTTRCIPKHYDLSSLRILGSVGEPINPAAWEWYHQHVGGGRCPIVDTFWQTETGGHMITPLPGATPLVPGSCTLPFPGIAAAIVDETGNDVPNGQGGILVIKKPWPEHDPHDLGRPGALQEELLPAGAQGLLPGRRRRDPRREDRLLHHHRPHRRRAQRVGPPHGHDGDRVGAGVVHRAGGRGRGGRAGPTTRPARRSAPSSC